MRPGSGAGICRYVNDMARREVFGANLKIIMGFPGSTEIRLAVERGELDGDCGGFTSVPPDWLRDGKAHRAHVCDAKGHRSSASRRP